jgi:RNA polymerase sigma-70 factor (ECF subfamily)
MRRTNPMSAQDQNGCTGRSFDTTSLLHLAQDGNLDAVEELFRKCQRRLRRWAHGRLPPGARDHSDTNDLVQDVLVQTFKRLDLFDVRGEGALHAYLRQALLNRIRDHIRRAQRRPTAVSLDPDQPDPAASPLETCVGRELLRRYDDALERLTVQDRELIVSTVEMGLDFEELARITRRASADAARKATRRALVRLAVEMSHVRGRA